MARVRWSVPLPGPFSVSGGVPGGRAAVGVVKAVPAVAKLGWQMGQHWASFWVLLNISGLVWIGMPLFLMGGPVGLLGGMILWAVGVTLLTMLVFTLPWAIRRGASKRQNRRDR